MRPLILIAGLFAGLAQAAEPISIDVHRDANCGCCKAWISHLQDNGFSVNDHVESDMSAVKQRLGVPPRIPPLLPRASTTLSLRLPRFQRICLSLSVCR